MQVGNRWECQAAPGGKLPAAFRRAANICPARPGLPDTFSVAACSVPALKQALTRQRQPWCEAGENGYLKGGFKRRQIIAVWPAVAPAEEPPAGEPPAGEPLAEAPFATVGAALAAKGAGGAAFAAKAAPTQEAPAVVGAPSGDAPTDIHSLFPLPGALP
jgi:hypothetical protein